MTRSRIITGFSLFFLITFNYAQVSHTIWNVLLKNNVSTSGSVDYKGFINQKDKLEEYLNLLSKNEPKGTWSKNEKMAYWINAYNAFTIQLIIDNYPLESIKDIAGKIYKVNTPWDVKFIEIGEKTYDLNNIEHSILRKKFNDPRIHFAINCASVSCPNLRNEAFTSDKLDKQLEEQATKFVNDRSKNTLSNSNIELSKIFSWFKGDFTKNQTLIAFINQYSRNKIDANAKILYKSYDWKLND